MLFNQKKNSGVSPVVGVILMVAVTVILAAVIGSFVLGLGNNVQANPQAGLTFDQDAGAGSVDIQLVSMENADYVTIKPGPGVLGVGGDYVDSDSDGNNDNLESVGDVGTVTGLTTGDKVTITGALEGKSAVLQTYTFK